jgi:hypothetical protein
MGAGVFRMDEVLILSGDVQVFSSLRRSPAECCESCPCDGQEHPLLRTRHKPYCTVFDLAILLRPPARIGTGLVLHRIRIRMHLLNGSFTLRLTE